MQIRIPGRSVPKDRKWKLLLGWPWKCHFCHILLVRVVTEPTPMWGEGIRAEPWWPSLTHHHLIGASHPHTHRSFLSAPRPHWGIRDRKGRFVFGQRFKYQIKELGQGQRPGSKGAPRFLNLWVHIALVGFWFQPHSLRLLGVSLPLPPLRRKSIESSRPIDFPSGRVCFDLSLWPSRSKNNPSYFYKSQMRCFPLLFLLSAL